jgi:hypothetical protein
MPIVHESVDLPILLEDIASILLEPAEFISMTTIFILENNKDNRILSVELNRFLSFLNEDY